MNSRLIIFVLLLIMGMMGGYFYISRYGMHPPFEAPSEGMSLKIGEEAPNLELVDLEGKKHQIKDFRGKVLLINFWATWCPPCLIEMPSLSAAYRKLSDRGFEVLAINLDENPKPVQEFVEEQKPSFKIFADPQGRTAEKYLVYGLPYTILVDRQGRIRHKIFGGHEWDKGEAFEKIKSLL